MCESEFLFLDNIHLHLFASNIFLGASLTLSLHPGAFLKAHQIFSPCTGGVIYNGLSKNEWNFQSSFRQASTEIIAMKVFLQNIFRVIRFLLKVRLEHLVLSKISETFPHSMFGIKNPYFKSFYQSFEYLYLFLWFNSLHLKLDQPCARESTLVFLLFSLSTESWK